MDSTEDTQIIADTLEDISGCSSDLRTRSNNYRLNTTPQFADSARENRLLSTEDISYKQNEQICKLSFDLLPDQSQTAVDLWELRELLAMSGLPSRVFKGTLVVFLPISNEPLDSTEEIDTSTAGKIAVPLRNCSELRNTLQRLADDGQQLHSRILSPSESDLIESQIKLCERTTLLHFGREIATKSDLTEPVSNQSLELLVNLLAAEIPSRIVQGRVFTMPGAGSPAEVVGVPLYNLPGIVYEIPRVALTRFHTVIDRATQQFDSELRKPIGSSNSKAAWKQLCQTLLSTIPLLGEPLFQSSIDPLNDIATQIISGTTPLLAERKVLRNVLINISGHLMTTDEEHNLILYAKLNTATKQSQARTEDLEHIWKLSPCDLQQMEAAIKAMYTDIIGSKDRNDMSFAERSNANQRMKIVRVHLTSLILKLGKCITDTEVPPSMRYNLKMRAETRRALLSAD